MIPLRPSRMRAPHRRFVGLCDVANVRHCYTGACSWQDGSADDPDCELWEVTVDRRTGVAFTHEVTLREFPVIRARRRRTKSDPRTKPRGTR